MKLNTYHGIHNSKFTSISTQNIKSHTNVILLPTRSLQYKYEFRKQNIKTYKR